MNTVFEYLYRDASNYKRFQKYVVKGEITDDQKKIVLNSLDEGLWFIPEQVGFPADRFDEYERSDDDHCWLELEEDGIYVSDNEPTDQFGLTINDVVEKFRTVTWNYLLI